ncbi:hypothetical protein HC761_00375 [bacterium]|nr:hypothetical protein [bacterium]
MLVNSRPAELKRAACSAPSSFDVLGDLKAGELKIQFKHAKAYFDKELQGGAIQKNFAPKKLTSVWQMNENMLLFYVFDPSKARQSFVVN